MNQIECGFVYGFFSSSAPLCEPICFRRFCFRNADECAIWAQFFFFFSISTQHCIDIVCINIINDQRTNDYANVQMFDASVSESKKMTLL